MPHAIIASIASVIVGLIAGYLVRKYIAELKIASAEQAAQRISEEAKKEAEGKKRELFLKQKKKFMP